jgi:CpeT protein
MNRLPILLLGGLLLIGFCACSPAKKAAKAEASLYQLMTGSFNSAEQATADSSYFNISLHMYPIWTEREGNWLYVEQALFTMQDQPYRQRIYQVERLADNTFQSKVYTLPEPEKFIGKWNTPSAFDELEPSMLEEREGCAVFMTQTGKNRFEGATNEQDCGSQLRGASYATSKVQISPGRIESWDQGFDAEGNQVWGATKGGYIFKKY